MHTSSIPMKLLQRLQSCAAGCSGVQRAADGYSDVQWAAGMGAAGLFSEPARPGAALLHQVDGLVSPLSAAAAQPAHPQIPAQAISQAQPECGRAIGTNIDAVHSSTQHNNRCSTAQHSDWCSITIDAAQLPAQWYCRSTHVKESYSSSQQAHLLLLA